MNSLPLIGAAPEDKSTAPSDEPLAPAYTCTICSKNFTRKSILNDHLNAHNGIKPYVCSHCRASFVRKSDLKQHEQATHENRSVFRCEDWDKTSEETGDTCRYKGCQQGFSRRASLFRHRVSKRHTLLCTDWIFKNLDDNESQKLEGCGVEFDTREQLLKHRLDKIQSKTDSHRREKQGELLTGLQDTAIVEKPLGDNESSKRFEERDKTLYSEIITLSKHDPGSWPVSISMRLLRADDEKGFSLSDVRRGEEIPKYAVLSHTWSLEEQEVTFEDIKNGTGTKKEGYAKLRFCCQQAKQDGLEYFWVDTCCINKSDSTELNEAIKSMFRWYSRAEKCYAFLSDVTTRKHGRNETDREWQSQFRASKWHRRGWTLQELLAPRKVEFWSRDHVKLGDKSSMEQVLHEITSIPYAALRGVHLSSFDPTSIKAWSFGRETLLEEDQAYCLMGLFDVSIPPIYGEGRAKAMERLHWQISLLVFQKLQRSEAKYQVQRHHSVISPGVFSQPRESSPKAWADHRLPLEESEARSSQRKEE